MASCLRCGYCCKNYICFVPKYETSNLSPEFLDTMNYESANNYIEANIEEQGSVCKWLSVDKFGLHVCLAYNRRSSMCIDHNSELSTVCQIGYYYWKDKADIPDEISALLKENPSKFRF